LNNWYINTLPRWWYWTDTYGVKRSHTRVS